MRDTSLACRRAYPGTIVEVRVFNRRGVDKTSAPWQIERAEIERLAKDRDDERRSWATSSRLKELLLNR